MYQKQTTVNRYLTSTCLASDSELATVACYCPECKEIRQSVKGLKMTDIVTVIVWVDEALAPCVCPVCLNYRWHARKSNGVYSGRKSAKCYRYPSRFHKVITEDLNAVY